MKKVCICLLLLVIAVVFSLYRIEEGFDSQEMEDKENTYLFCFILFLFIFIIVLILLTRAFVHNNIYLLNEAFFQFLYTLGRTKGA
jgi:presenilin-like A22 family membrane protease